jgi:hypothetical protein
MAGSYRGRHTTRRPSSTASTGWHVRGRDRHHRAHPSRRRIRWIVVVLACTAVISGGLTSLPHATAVRATSRFTPVADAYVSETRPDRNFASTPGLRTRGSRKPELSYLRFAVAQLPGAVTAARLRLYAETASRIGYAVHSVAAGDWTEERITYATAPTVGPVVAASGVVSRDTWTSVDVTSIVHGDGVLDLVLTSDDKSAGLYASRETGVTAPQLVVETVEDSTAGESTTTTRAATTTTGATTTTRATTTTTSATTTTGATTTTTSAPAPSGTLGYGTAERPFAASSAWNRAIPADPTLASNSAGMIRRLSSGGHYNVTSGAWGQFGAPVFLADASTPRYTWGSHCGPISGKQVPIPPGSHEAQGTASADHKYIVIDTSTKLVYDIWQADVQGRDCLKYGQGYGIIESLTTANDGAPGINGEKAPTGASTSSLAGLLRAYDATHLDVDGTYGHALQGSSMYSAKGRWVSPATSSDGPDTSPDAIPQGSRLQLNPSFNCGAISTPGVRAYCRTAQKYGIILIDTSPVHALTIYQEDVKDNTPATGNPFAGGYWGTDADWPSLASVPLNQFRVVAPF